MEKQRAFEMSIIYVCLIPAPCGEGQRWPATGRQVTLGSSMGNPSATSITQKKAGTSQAKCKPLTLDPAA